MIVTSDGERLLGTDYWTSPHARRGLVYCSVNAGAVRLLVPPPAREVATAVVGSRAARLQLAGAAAVGVIHLVLEDGSASPYVLTIDARQLVSAGQLLDIPVLDHVIVAGDRFTSFATAGIL
jgi:hypothetical protein